MKAAVYTQYGSPDVLQVQEVAKPVPTDDEVSIKVHATSINDWDWGLVTGTPFYMRILSGLRKPKYNIPGVDVAGTVEAVGRNVQQFQPGDEVYGDLSACGFGSLAEYVCAPENALTRKPVGMSFVDAAAIPHAAALALQGLRDVGQLQPGQKLLINGAGGGVGTLGVQIAKAMGVEEITGVDSADKLEMMRALGYTHTIDYRQADFTKNGQTYDLILDAKTNRSPFAYARALAPNGMYVTVGGATSRLIQALLLGPLVDRLHKKSIRIVALKPNKDLAYINELFEAGKLKVAIDGPYPLSEVAQALRHFGEGRHKGKVIIALEDYPTT
jgi:NADPH:quinone reductase-like Zn-dependent oxidoreductase